MCPPSDRPAVYGLPVDDDTAARLRLAVDMYAVGVAMRRQQLVRTMPGSDRTAVDAALAAWLRTRPGAVDGDVSVTTPAP